MNWKSAPQFLQTIIEKFNSGQSNQFILYGNVRDLYSLGKDQFYSLTDCLKRLMDPPEGGQRRGRCDRLNPIGGRLGETGRDTCSDYVSTARSIGRVGFAEEMRKGILTHVIAVW